MKNLYAIHYYINTAAAKPAHLKKLFKLLALQVLMLFAFTLDLYAQVLVDNTSFGSSVTKSPVTVSHTTGTGSDRLMLVGVSTRDRTVTGVTYNRVALIPVGVQTSNNNVKTAIYSMIAPPDGTFNVVVSLSGDPGKGAVVGVMTFTGVNQTTPLGTYASAVGNSTTAALNVTSASSELVFNVVSVQNQNIVNTAGQTQRWNVNTSSENTGAGATKSGSAITSLSWTLVKDDWSMSGISIKPLATADLQITKTANTTTPILENQITFTLTAKNDGPDAATLISATDVLPSGFSYVSHTASGTTTYNSGTGVWTIGSLANQATATLTITANVLCSADYKNIAIITSKEPDPETGNNTAVLIINPQNTISTTFYFCPGETYNLTSHSPCNTPGGTTTVTWHDGTPASTANELPNASAVTAGTYYVAFYDHSNDCYSPTTPFTIIAYPALQGATILTQSSCFLNGSIALNVTGGTAPYSYDWVDLSGISNPEDRSGLLPGDYSVTVTDAHGCSWTSGNLTLLTPDGCTGKMVCQYDAASVFSVDPDPDNTSYYWTVPTGADIVSGQNSPSIEVNWGAVAPGSYQVCVIAGNICGTVSQICLDVYVNNTIASATLSEPVCEGNALQLYASGGSSYYWTGPNGFTSSSPNPVIYGATHALNSGTYTVTVTGSSGCTATADVEVLINPQPLVTGTVTNASCGLTTGSIDINPSGGSGDYSYIWTNGEISQDLTNISADNYSVWVTDNTTGCSKQATFTVVDDDGPVASVTAVNVSCSTGTNGSVDLTVTDGTPGYTYLWSNGATTEDLSGLTVGTYNVVVTDANGCKGAATINITEPFPLTLDQTHTNINCYGGTTGSINLIVSGGTGSYNYTWTKNGSPYGSNVQDLSGLSSGTYSVTVTDGNSCSANLSVTLTQPIEALTATATPNHVSCFGNSDGFVTLNIVGGTAPYSYNWTGPGTFTATTKNISGLAAGTYSVTITDHNGCQFTVNSVTIAQPDMLSLSGSQINVKCFGGSDGEIDLSVSGGTSSYTYSWSNGATSQDINGLVAGTYTVTVFDAHGCSAEKSFNVTQPTILTAFAVAASADCSGTSTGSVTLTVGGGTTEYTYLWSNGATAQNLTDVPAGTYSVTVTDANGCTAQASATVTQPSQIVISAIVTNSVCYSGTTGAINITVTGGAGSYTFDWDDIGTAGEFTDTEDRTNLSAGNYAVTVKDNNGCTSTATYTITQPAEIFLTAIPSNISCFGGSDGSINLTVSGGKAPYSYLWSSTATTEDLTGLSAGTYSVTVKDANFCEKILTNITISAPTQLTLATSVVKAVNCLGGNNGSATATPTGGTAPYTYLWSNGSTAQTPANFSAGTYSVIVTDSKGCNASGNITITEPATEMELYYTTLSSSSCGNSTGSIDLTVVNGTGPYTYTWSPSQGNIQDPTGLAEGTYSVTVTDALGCTANLSVVVEKAPTLVVNLEAFNSSCLATDGSVYAEVTGGVGPYTYLWSPGGANTSFITGLSSGLYSVLVTDVNGCTANASATLVAPTCISPVANNDFFTSCSGSTVVGSVAINDTDGDNTISQLEFLPLNGPAADQGAIIWDESYNGDFVFSPTIGYNGTIEIRYMVEDPLGLKDEGLLIIYVSQMTAEVTAANTTHVECGATGGSATITHTGGFASYTYSKDGTDYSNTTGTFTGLAPGSYTLYVKDSKGCIVSATVTIQNSCLTVTKTVDQATISAPGTLTYTIVVANTGTSLTNVVVADAFATTGPTLSSGDTNTNGIMEVTETWTYTATKTVTQAMIDAGTALVNTASVTTAEVTTPVTDDATTTITKVSSVTPSTEIEGTDLTHTVVMTGASATAETYAFSVADVTATVNVDYDLANVVFTNGVTYDMNTGLITLPAGVTSFEVTFPGMVDLLDENDETYNLTIGGESATGTILDNHIPSLAFSKTQISGPNPVTSAAQVITYEIKVENTGSTLLTNVNVSESYPGSGAGTLSSATESIISNGILEIGEIWTYTASYTVTQVDIEVGLDLVNTANVTTYEIPGPTIANATTKITQTPELTATKSATETAYGVVGDVLHYTIEVENTGNVTVSNITVTDPKAMIISGNPILSLAVGDKAKVTAEHTVTQADIDAGFYTNMAAASGFDTNGDPVTDETNEVTVSAKIKKADLSVEKNVNVENPEVGSLINFIIRVKNNGPDHATEVMVNDKLPSGYTFVSSSSDIGSYNYKTGIWAIGGMASGTTYRLTITSKVNVSGDYRNTAIIESAVEDPNLTNNFSEVTVDPIHVKEVEICELFIPEIFSPNGDGIQDYFKIRCIDRYLNAKIEIYNRWGNLVYKKDHYGDTDFWGSTDAWWDGHSNQKWKLGTEKLPPATYFYILILNDGSEVRNGYLYLNR